MAKKYYYRRYISNPIPKRYKWQPRHQRILELLDQYGRLDTYQIQALLPRQLKRIYPRSWRPQKPKPTWIPTTDENGKSCFEVTEPPSQRVVELHLQNLFHDNPSLVHRQRHDPNPIVHSITNAGREKLAKGKLPPKKPPGREHIDHTLMITRFRATLDLALQPQQKTHLSLWQKESADLKAVIKLKGQRLVVKPDGFFTIQHRGKTLHYFLEADRSTMTRKRYLAKLRAYWLWWKQGGHQRTFKIPNFRVLTFTISEQRNQNLRQLAKQADDKKQGSPMFLFDCDKSFSLEDPATILNPLWQTPLNDNYHSLLD